jgi:hypothetical protein
MVESPGMLAGALDVPRDDSPLAERSGRVPRPIGRESPGMLDDGRVPSLGDLAESPMVAMFPVGGMVSASPLGTLPSAVEDSAQTEMMVESPGMLAGALDVPRDDSPLAERKTRGGGGIPAESRASNQLFGMLGIFHTQYVNPVQMRADLTRRFGGGS